MQTSLSKSPSRHLIRVPFRSAAMDSVLSFERPSSALLTSIVNSSISPHEGVMTLSGGPLRARHDVVATAAGGVMAQVMVVAFV